MSSYLNEIRVCYKRMPCPRACEPLTSSQKTFLLLRDLWEDNIDHLESIYILILNRANEPVSYHRLSVGGRTRALCDMVVLFQILLKTNSHAFILAHNHTTNRLTPSQSDIALTQRVKKLANLFEITFLDHLIINQEDYYSFADHKVL